MTFYQELQLNQAGSKNLLKKSETLKEKLYHMWVYLVKIAATMAFCFFFVSIFSILFGNENSIKKVGVDELKNVLDAMQPQVKISTVLSYQGGKQQAQPSTYAKLSDVPSDALLEMREHNPEEYKRLYKAEYGMTCEI